MCFVKNVPAVLLILLLTVALAVPAYAADSAQTAETTQTTEAENATLSDKNASVGLKAVAVGIAIGLAASGGAVGMGIVGGKAADGISRQPEMEGKIRTTLMLDLVFIETAIIYALLVVILVIFVL